MPQIADGQFCLSDAGVAQLVRVPACHAGGREFKSRHSRHHLLVFSGLLMVLVLDRVISSVGRALRLHRRCRQFESVITHHFLFDLRTFLWRAVRRK